MVHDARLIGRSLRIVRRELRLRQGRPRGAGRLSQTFVSRVERGLLTGVPVEELVALFDAVGARLELRPWWNGAALDRLLDRRHAALTEFVVGVLEHAAGRSGWR